METSLVSRHEKCLSIVHKNHKTIFMLLRAATQGSLLKIVELDITTHTVCSNTVCLVFEGVQPHDSNYTLLYSCGFLVLVYPNQMICIYQDNDYFARRSQDQQGCKGIDFFDENLAAQDNSCRIALKHVVQSQVSMLAPLLQDTNLIFLSLKPSQQSQVDTGEPIFLIHLPLSEIDILSHSNKHAIFSQQDSKAGKDKNIQLRRSPLQDLKSTVTDMIQVSRHSYAVAFTCGTLWIASFLNQEFMLLGLDQMAEFMGQETKTSCINAIDQVLIPWKQSTSLNPNLFDESQDNGPRVTEFLMFGDASGNLILFKNRKPVFQDQITYGQVAAVKFLNVSLNFALISSDGVLRICRFCPLSRKVGESNNLFEVVKLANVQSFEELNSQLKLRQINLRGSVVLQTHAQGSALESTFDTVQVLWPNRIMMKVNNKRQTAEEKIFAECELQIYKVFPSFHPMVKRNFTPIVLSNVLPMQFRDFVAHPDPETGTVQMSCERHCFFIDQIGGQSSQRPQNWISVYDFAKDTKTPLVNVTAESGVHDLDHFAVVRVDMRPGGLVSAAGVAKFLVTLELSNGQQGVSGLCCSFGVDMSTGSLTQNVLQLSGRTGIYLGKLDYKDPSILVLQEDTRSLIIFSFDEGDLDRKLPHGEVRLSSKVNGVYWTPMRDGLAVLYELQQENLLTFSKNRLERYAVKDFGILVSRNIGLKLHYEERIFDVKWTGFSLGFAPDNTQTVKGVIGTNQHIYFVGDKLQAIGVMKWTHQAITSLQWMGDQTVLATTRSQLVQIYCERHPRAGVVFSLIQCLEKSSYEGDDLPETPILVKALADRVVFAQRKLGGPVKFFSRPMLMLEPILLGYLLSAPPGKLNVESVQNCLKYLDTVAISQKLLQALTSHGLMKSVKFLLKNQSMLTSKVGLQPQQILRIEDFEDFLQTIFPQRDLFNSDQDLVHVRKKLMLDPACILQKKLLQKRASNCLKKEQHQDAFTCGDLLEDIDLQVKILQTANLPDSVIREFLTLASKVDQHKTVRFDYRSRLTNKYNIDRISKRVPERNLQKLMLAFDEVPLTYTCPLGPDDIHQTVLMAPVAFNAENFSTYVGVTKYLDPGLRNNLDAHANAQVSDGDDQDNQDGQNEDDFKDFVDEVDEKRHLRAYWRGEEGQGKQVLDVADKAMHLKAENLEWHQQANLDRDPLDYEDKWGKVNIPNYALIAPSSGLDITCRANQALCTKAGGFTFEMWLKEPEPNDYLVLALFTEEKQLSLFLNRENGQLICQLYNLLSKNSPATRSLAESIDLRNWTHLAIQQMQTKITLFINFEQVAEFQGKNFNVGDANSQFKVLQAVSATGVSATELRLWQIPLSARQLKSMARQPLSILFEQKRNLSIQINKNKSKSKQKVSEQGSVSNQAPEEQKDTLPKKKGGLKFTSKLDANKVVKSAEQPAPSEEKVVIEQPAVMPKPAFEAFAFDGFDMGLSNPSNPNRQESNIPGKDQFFSFLESDSEPKPLKHQLKSNTKIAEVDFFSFDQAIAHKPSPKKSKEPTNEFSSFDFFLGKSPPVHEESSPKEAEVPVQQEKSAFDIFNFAEIEPRIADDEESKTLIIPLKQTHSVNELDMSFQSETSSKKLRLSEILKISRRKESVQPSEVEFEKQVDSLQQPSFDQMMESVEQLIIQANLQDASFLIQKALEKCKQDAQTVISNEEKLVVKNRIRRNIVMKFTCDIATRISEVKCKIKTVESPFQKANLQSQIASMANVLILLKLPDAMRTNFFRFALKKNKNCENYSALSKICSYWQKYSESMEGMQFLTDKDRQMITQTEALCKNRQNRNVQQYHGDDCPQCGANLAFGLATPQCHKCKVKIAICYQTLKPVLKDKQMLKCHVCLAQFSIFAMQVNDTCPNCQLVKLKLNVA